MNSQDLFNVKGIGRMIAEGFFNAGARVYISGREAKACEAFAAELAASPAAAKHGGSAVALPANLQSLDECKRLVAAVAEREPRGLHVLVNNAGATWGEGIETYPDAAWHKLMTLNVTRVFSLTQLCIPLLEAAATAEDPARVVHIGSIDGLRTPPMETYAYSASKAALHHLSRGLARHLGPRNITSNVIACGPFRSKMMRATLEKTEHVLNAEVPLRRIGTPEDVAGTCIYLASRAGAFCNGALIRLDGGTSLVSKI
ncbi:Rhamnolipids biosynthesis 3-oxoacyl-reductase [Escovopsis weberi]|uniref:Rhamnolipids biosynthesis 3-oxoacyl-reductase n=1 Tax=Escovopsis weberi TaxID=150374 RepID=A0A0M9VW37_ESCWE|nr:Rhamnolipids biosynthesis 3-oxoacyl-reductase [Escovopsis weberi]